MPSERPGCFRWSADVLLKNTPARGEESRGPGDRRNCLRYSRAFREKLQDAERALCVSLSPRLLCPVPLATKTHAKRPHTMPETVTALFFCHF